ncbi:hypothetical protein [Ruthenibacterium lactatiformans]|uniref:hypothetical protein n=1 Tax=Ruthenibacterium lactatiformans TaxID=1550024 RepID=UPI001058E80B|nr:hypothetical protein [Ruthenibacterium lactatiformans]
MDGDGIWLVCSVKDKQQGEKKRKNIRARMFLTLLLSGCAEKNNSFVSSEMPPVPSMAANECGSLPAAESARPGGRGCCPFL